MITIRPNALYSRADLAAMLAPLGVDVDHFIARLRPRKVFKMVWYGADILKALEQAPALAEREDQPAAVAAANSKKQPGKRRGRQAPVNLITLDEISR